MIPRIPRSMLLDVVYCGICYQRPWKTVAYESPMEMAIVLKSWCHGAFRRWILADEVIKVAVARDNFDRLVRALVAFASLSVALAPMLVAIRRMRGRRLPLPDRGQLRVWLI